MKNIIKITLLLLVPFFGSGQVFFDESKTYSIERDFVLIPTIQFGYNIMQDDFLAVNNGLKVERSFILPEAYIGCQLLSNGFLIGFHYGVLQNTILLSGGVAIPFKVKKYKPNG